MSEARRYNKDKIRYELISTVGLERLAEVYTKGAEKYTLRNEKGDIIDDGSNNWRKGQDWMGVIASVQRHIEAWKKGEDFDPDLGTRHLANAAWGLFALLDFEKYHPDKDNRLHSYLSDKKVGIDIDGVIADFNGAIHTLAGVPGHAPVDWEDPNINRVYQKVKADKKFWLDLQPLVHVKDIPFQPHCYITSRSIDPEVTKEWLNNHGFADVPLYCVGSGESKVETALKSGVHYFIDDYYRNFVELNKAGICTFLLSRSWNSKYDVGFKRIKDFNDFKQRFL